MLPCLNGVRDIYIYISCFCTQRRAVRQTEMGNTCRQSAFLFALPMNSDNLYFKLYQN